MKKLLLLILTLQLASCGGLISRVENIGKAPELKEINNYEAKETMPYKGNDMASIALPEDRNKGGLNSGYVDGSAISEKAHHNSLWASGSRSFFRDKKARAVGDILKVKLELSDSAKLDNSTTKNRAGTSTIGAPSILGFEKKIGKILPQAADPAALVSIDSADDSSGAGTVNRKETIKATVAATVVKILPSNNLVIRGTQEIRINYELREITVEGIVRPEDISAQNSISLDQIAEARVSYGGRGHISDYQQDRYGKQLLDIVTPF